MVPRGAQWVTANACGYTASERVAFARMVGVEVFMTPYYGPESNGMGGSLCEDL